MAIYGIYCSKSEACGICIFSRHLEKSLYKSGIHLKSINIYSKPVSLPNGCQAILHYTPSCFATQQASDSLVFLLLTCKFDNLVVIFHGLHAEFENRYVKDTICIFQQIHLNVMLERNAKFVALSSTVAQNLKSWIGSLGDQKKVVTVDHPGLYIKEPSDKENSNYAFLGGIARSKKNFYNPSEKKLIYDCNEQGINIWMHWSNLTLSDYSEEIIHKVWKITSGVISDQTWCNIITNSKIVLCPYHTKIQSVSGLICEAISAKCFVLSTDFDFAVDTQKRFPAQIIINNQIEDWPVIIKNIFDQNRVSGTAYITWKKFTTSILNVFIENKEIIEL